MEAENLIGKWFKHIGKSCDWFKKDKWYKCIGDIERKKAFLDDANEPNGIAPLNHIYFDLSNPQDNKPE